jgi:lipoyl-dependent peroxiredoxin
MASSGSACCTPMGSASGPRVSADRSCRRLLQSKCACAAPPRSRGSRHVRARVDYPRGHGANWPELEEMKSMATYTIKPLVTATAINTGGRNGHSETTDHSISVDLSVRKEMGGPGRPSTTTPEHLFAAGYAACFGGALDFVAQQHKKNVSGSIVTCDTSVGPREGGGFGIAVRMHVKIPNLPTAEASALVQETHDKICPYSHATRGNIDFVMEIEGA